MVHFVLITIHDNPFNKEKSKAGYLASAYVYPYFHQNWNLFVPAPVCNYSLFATVENDSTRTDIFKEILLKHQKNRLLGYEPLVIAFSNAIHYFEKNSALQQKVNGPVNGDLYFNLLEHAAKNYLQHTQRKKIEKIKLILVVENVLDRQRRIYFN